uniref:RNase H type-1 domain-containing protein n=1 Tax=Fagus sylvatica TaxID=28930 RepID=A0A2N9G908_FAGSY
MADKFTAGTDTGLLIPVEQLRQPYPNKYVAPTFSRFDGRKGSALMHVSKFMDSIGPYAGNGDSCLREFSKFLDDRAYKWYTTLPPRSMRSWDDMVEMFCGKYFQVDEKITLINLHCTKQGNGEDLLKYIHCFRDISLDCYTNYEESELVGVCIENMSPEFRAHLENLDISRRSTEKEFRKPPAPVPCTEEEMIAILNKWVAYDVIKLSEAQEEVTKEEKRNLKYCRFHRCVKHSTTDCWSLQRKFHAKIQDGTLELPQAQQKVHINPFLKHKGKATVSVIIHGGACDIDMDEFAATNLAMAPARTTATEAIMSIVAESGTHCFTTEAHASRAFLETTNAITFTNEDMDVPYPNHRCPLYLSSTVNEVQVRHALVDTGSCINLVPLSTLQAAEIFQKKIQGAPMEVKGFRGVAEYTEGHILLVLKVGPIIALTRLNRKPIHIAANPTPFDQSESHFVEAALYDEITLVGEASLSKPVGTPLPKCGGPDYPQQEGPESREGSSQPSCYVVDEADNSELADATGKSVVAEEPTATDPKISAKEELEVIDLSSDPSVQKLVSISASLSALERTQLVALLKEYQDVFACKFLGFLVHQRGIDVDPTRASAIATMKPPTTHKELKSFFGKLSYIRRFIPGLAAVTSTFAPLLKKGVPFRWSLECQQAFEKVQDIMTKLPTICAPIFGKLLWLYLASNNQAIRALVAQEDSHGVEQPIYYINHALKDTETHYSGPVLSGRLAQWLLQLSQYEIIAETPIAIKSQMLPWTLRFDGSFIAMSSGTGIVLFRDDGEAIPKSFKLDFPCSNNAVEYEAYLAGLAVACEMGIKHLKVIGDSNLIIEYAQRNENRYADALATLGSQMAFEGQKIDITINKKEKPIIELLKREFEESSFVEEDWRMPLKAKLMSLVVAADFKEIKDYTLIFGELYRRLPGGVLARCISIQEAKRKLIEVHEKTCEDGGGISLYRRLQRLGYYWPNMSREAADLQSILSQTHKEVYRLKILASRYFVEGRTLFWKGYHGEPLWYLSLSESQMVMKETHVGECGEHQGKKRLYQHLLTLGYYWSTMKKDMADFVKTCHTCQVQANLIHTHPTNLQNMATPWPFHTWGLDLIGPIDVLWAYRSLPKTTTGFTPFSLVYGTDTISPTKLVVPTPRVLQGSDLEVDASICAEARMMVLKAVDFVRKGLPSPSKFSPNWERPYLVREAHGSGYYKLSKSDGTTLADHINGKWLKHYYS